MATHKSKALLRYSEFYSLTMEIFEKYAKMDITLLKCQPTDGGWSVLQVLEHLLDSEAKSFGYLKKKTLDYSGVKKKNLSTSIRSGLLRLSLKSSMKFKAPTVLQDPPNQMSVADLKRDFDKQRKEIQDLISNLPADAFNLELFKHPIAGRLTIHQMFDFMTDHWGHHQKQIENILQTVA